MRLNRNNINILYIFVFNNNDKKSSQESVTPIGWDKFMNREKKKKRNIFRTYFSGWVGDEDTSTYGYEF